MCKEKEKGAFIMIVARGEGATYLAGRAIEEYLKESKNDLSVERKIYAEDYLRRKIGHKKVTVGSKITFSRIDIQNAIDEAEMIDTLKIKNLKKYISRAKRYNICLFLDIDTGAYFWSSTPVNYEDWNRIYNEDLSAYKGST